MNIQEKIIKKHKHLKDAKSFNEADGFYRQNSFCDKDHPELNKNLSGTGADEYFNTCEIIRNKTILEFILKELNLENLTFKT